MASRPSGFDADQSCRDLPNGGEESYCSPRGAQEFWYGTWRDTRRQSLEEGTAARTDSWQSPIDSNQRIRRDAELFCFVFGFEDLYRVWEPVRALEWWSPAEQKRVTHSGLQLKVPSWLDRLARGRVKFPEICRTRAHGIGDPQKDPQAKVRVHSIALQFLRFNKRIFL